MKLMFTMIVGAMVIFSDIWAVHGIGIDARVMETCVVCRYLLGVFEADGIEQTCSEKPTSTSSVSIEVPTLTTPVAARQWENSTLFIPTSSCSSKSGDSSEDVLSALPRSDGQTDASLYLSAAAKAGIITASIAVFLLVLFLILEYTYLGKKRRERALQRAVEEVERGTELKDTSHTGSKENMVLESRVEIVVDGGDESDGDLGEWGHGRRWERGRSGMSLPRQEE
jgi:hypothetical protein